MKEDILEQLVEDWLQSQGYFTRTNVKYSPVREGISKKTNKNAVDSDIDVVGFHPGKDGPERVLVVNCKSWQKGFNIKTTLRNLTNTPDTLIAGRAYWKHFRELVREEWSKAFISALTKLTHNTGQFTYVTAVTLLKDPKNRSKWSTSEVFKNSLGGNPVRLVTLKEMLDEMLPKLGKSVESSQFSRTLQLFKASGIGFASTTIKPSPTEE